MQRVSATTCHEAHSEPGKKIKPDQKKCKSKAQLKESSWFNKYVVSQHLLVSRCFFQRLTNPTPAIAENSSLYNMGSSVPKGQSNWHTSVAQLIQAFAFASMASFKPLFLVLFVRAQGVLCLLPSTAVGLPQPKNPRT